jgi:hypothetical protein
VFTSADEAREYFDSLISEKRQIVVECDVAISALESAHEYIEGVITESESGDLLPSASSFEIDLFDRQMMISDRIGEREDMRLRAESSIDGLEWERDDLVQGLEQREHDREDAEDSDTDGDDGISDHDQEMAAAYYDEVLGPVDNSRIEIMSEAEDARQEMWARYVDNILGDVDNSGIVILPDPDDVV